MDAAHLPPGFVIAGRYCVEATIGQGGMAVVYRARHLGTEKPCALKLLLPELADDPKLRELFLQEARVSGRIGSSPYIVDVFDTGVAGQFNTPFIAMELLHGATLAKLLRQRAVPRDAVESILLQLGKGLEAAHKAGVVHRDLKPGNIFVSEGEEGEPRVKILDFGIAKVLEGPQGRTATQAGSPWYSAPEQLGGSMRKLAAKHGFNIATGVSPATDVWAFGLCACEIVLGLRASRYWGAETSADLMLRVSLEPRRPPSERVGVGARVVPGFDEWFLRCTAHDSTQRFQSAIVAAEALVALLRRADQNVDQDVTLRLPPMNLGEVLAAVPRPDVSSPPALGSPSGASSPAAPTEPFGPAGSPRSGPARPSPTQGGLASSPEGQLQPPQPPQQPQATAQPSGPALVAGTPPPPARPWSSSQPMVAEDSHQTTSRIVRQGSSNALAGPGASAAMALAEQLRQPVPTPTPSATPSGSGSNARLSGPVSDSGIGSHTPSSLGFSDAAAMGRLSLPGADTSSSWQNSAVRPLGRRRVVLLAAAGVLGGLALLIIVVVSVGLGSRRPSDGASGQAAGEVPSATVNDTGMDDADGLSARPGDGADADRGAPPSTQEPSTEDSADATSSAEPPSTSSADATAGPTQVAPVAPPRPKGQEKLFEDF